jgi:hypothetical protein
MVDTASEAWRMECEARYVVNLAGLRLRRDYLEAVEKRRGQAARSELEAAVKVEWVKRKGKQ